MDDRSELHKMLSAVHPLHPAVSHPVQLPIRTNGSSQSPALTSTSSGSVPNVPSMTASPVKMPSTFIKDVEYPDIDNYGALCTVANFNTSTYPHIPASNPINSYESGYSSQIVASSTLASNVISTQHLNYGQQNVIMPHTTSAQSASVNIYNRHSVSYSTAGHSAHPIIPQHPVTITTHAYGANKTSE